MKGYLVSLMILLFFHSCSNNQGADNVSKSQEFFNINFEEILANKRQINLSQLASDIKYIILETNDDCMINRNVEYFFTDSLIFIKNLNHILKYSRNGKFLKKIGNPGRGPGEIDLIRIMSILPDKRLIIVQLNSKRELLYFNFDGKLVKTIDLTTPYYQIKILDEGKYVVYNKIFMGNEQYSFILANEEWDTISTVENYTKWDRNTYFALGYSDFKPFYFYNGHLYLKTMYNDTVYTIESEKIKPSYFINLGKYKLPEELIPDKLGREQLQKFRDNSKNHFFAMVHEASNKVFFKAPNYQESINKYILFDKKYQKGTLLANENADSKGFINDWDGGIDFWPVGNLNDNQVYMPVYVMDLQKSLEKNKISKISSKYKDKQEQLLDLISSLDVSSNPILMVVTLKND